MAAKAFELKTSPGHLLRRAQQYAADLYAREVGADGLTPYQAVLKGSLVRLRTVLMTALLAMLGLLPMALSHSIGSETQKPLAVVIIGGLLSATALTLIVLPTLYLVFVGRGGQTTPDASRPTSELRPQQELSEAPVTL